MTPEQKKELLPKQKSVALELKKEGRTQAEVAALLGVPEGTIARWLSGIINNLHTKNANNAEHDDASAEHSALDRRIKLTPDDKKDIVERVEAGETQAQVAAI